MRIAILGTGTLAAALGAGWVDAGHDVVVGGRSPERAAALADRLAARPGLGRARAATPREAVAGRDAVLLAVRWDGAEDVLRAAGAHEGALAGTVLIDPTNAVEHGVGVLLTGDGESAAERVAAVAAGAHVVKAFHLVPSDTWSGGRAVGTTVVLCGDDPGALDRVGELVRDLGAAPAVLGPLRRARQAEEAAGFAIGLAFAGVDPASALPRLPSGAGG